jgi:hypothetical protein
MYVRLMDCGIWCTGFSLGYGLVTIPDHVMRGFLNVPAPYVRCDACVRLLRNEDTQSLIVVGTNMTARAIGQLVLWRSQICPFSRRSPSMISMTTEKLAQGAQ